MYTVYIRKVLITSMSKGRGKAFDKMGGLSSGLRLCLSEIFKQWLFRNRAEAETMKAADMRGKLN